MKMNKNDIAIYYEMYKRGYPGEKILHEFGVDDDWLEYKFDLIDFHGIDWFLEYNREGRYIHYKIRAVYGFKKSKQEYRMYSIKNGFYSYQTMRKGIKKFQKLTN